MGYNIYLCFNTKTKQAMTSTEIEYINEEDAVQINSATNIETNPEIDFHFNVKEAGSSQLAQCLFNTCLNDVIITKTEGGHFGKFASMKDITKAIRSSSAFKNSPEKGTDVLTVRTSTNGESNKIFVEVLYTAMINREFFPEEITSKHVYKYRIIYTAPKDDSVTKIEAKNLSPIQNYGSKLTYLTRYAMRSLFTNTYDSFDDIDSSDFVIPTSTKPSTAAVRTTNRKQADTKPEVRRVEPQSNLSATTM